MKILQITKRYFPFNGGIEQVTKDMVDCLPDHENIVIAYNHEKGNCVDMVGNAKVYRVNCQLNLRSQPIALGYGKQLKNIFQQEKPDVVVFHFPNPFASHYLLKYLPKNVKLIVYWHADIVKQKLLKKLFVGQTKRLLNRANVVVASSPNYVEKSEFLSEYRDKVKIIPNCISINRFVETENVEQLKNEIKQKNSNKIICFAVGRHTQYKGMDHLIKASKFLNDNYKIYIGGQGDLTNQLKELAKGDDKIEFLGKLSDEQLLAYYQTCDVFCFPSVTKNEAFGLALAEGMYFEKPAVTFTIDGSGVNYVSLDGVTGIEVENCNDEAYAKAIIKLGENSTLRKELGANARKRVEELFLPWAFKNNTIELFGGLNK